MSDTPPEQHVDSVFYRPPRKRRTESPLSRDRIVIASVALLDRDGASALTMRKVAAELDVHATSLYWYVQRREDLIDLALDHVLAGPAGDLPGDDVPWDEVVLRVAKQYYDAFAAHPWAAGFAGTRPLIGPNAMALAGRIIAALTESGGTEKDRMIAATAISQQVLGAATTAVVARGLSNAPAEDYAAAVGTPQTLDIWLPSFDDVLTLLVDAIRTRLNPTGPTT
ncbi:TetR/AcrR family transcriptional regulator [Saccharopolyspora sp. 6M]|uniref:TetR/AcrR family transcriptional regulator n=1 Tax=Saccharopolyspora sp. 6M TaxID=2877237 RepID=UPI001CD474D7|nr:TetR/AcrR family transcriptional regulator [Saccharopolyspora sp. 6M]MCA1226691.1 TetR/AcrR family transcriptional regulator [Saccharopolyspora sp. 6M]